MNLKQYLSPPTYREEEKNLQAHALHILLLYLSIAAFVIGGLSVIFIFTEKYVTGLLLIAAVTSFAFLIYLNHWGHVLIAAWIFFAVYWIFVTLLVVLSQGMRSLDITFYIAGTAAVGLILGIRNALYFALLTIVVGFGMAVLAQTGLIVFPDLFPFLPLSGWVVLTLNLVITVLLLNVSFKRISDALTLARQEIGERKRIEKALRASEEKFAKAFRVSPDLIIISEARIGGRFIDVNEGFERITGYSREEALEHSAQDLNLWQNREEQLQFLKKLSTNGRVVNEEVVLCKKTGELILG